MNSGLSVLLHTRIIVYSICTKRLSQASQPSGGSVRIRSSISQSLACSIQHATQGLLGFPMEPHASLLGHPFASLLFQLSVCVCEPTCLHPGHALKLPQSHLETMSLSIISRNTWDQAMVSIPSRCHVLSYEPQNTLSCHVSPSHQTEASVVMQDLPGITSTLDCGISCDSQQHEWEPPAS